MLGWRQFITECDGLITKRWASGNCTRIVQVELHSWEFQHAFSESIAIASIWLSCHYTDAALLRVSGTRRQRSSGTDHHHHSTRQCCNNAVGAWEQKICTGMLENKLQKVVLNISIIKVLNGEPLTFFFFFPSSFSIWGAWID